MATGHGGYYKHYLHRSGLDCLPNCSVCSGIPEDSEHIINQSSFGKERKSRGYSSEDAEVDGELAYCFLRNCIKEEESS